jgi:hypothetical protein
MLCVDGAFRLTTAVAASLPALARRIAAAPAQARRLQQQWRERERPELGPPSPVRLSVKNEGEGVSKR